MPSWKKVITSGSNASLNTLNVINGITGSLLGTASNALTASYINTLNQDVIITGSTNIKGNANGSLYVNSLITPVATFAGVISTAANGGAYIDNIDFDIYYSGESGSYHTELSPAKNYIATGNTYNDITFLVNNGISLTSGSIDTYTLWIHVKGNTNAWWSLSGQSIGTLQSGINVTLTNNTRDNLGVSGGDLSTAGFTSGSNPIPYPNTFLYQIPNPISFIGTTRITGSLYVTDNINGNLTGTASFADNATSASYAFNSTSASFALTAISSSYARNSTTASFASTASYVNTLVQNVTITGSLNISGSTTQIGNNTLLGNTTLSGSIIISGSLGTSDPTVRIYGDTIHNGYIRFDPVITNINTSISASYIYVSGSTNDLYFSQNGNGYNNVTRLRWLEGN